MLMLNLLVTEDQNELTPRSEPNTPHDVNVKPSRDGGSEWTDSQI